MMNKIYIIIALLFLSCSNNSETSYEEADKTLEVGIEIKHTDIGPQYTSQAKFTPGVFTDSGYVNSYFNFQIVVGSEWEILDKIEQKRMLDVTKSELTERNAKFERDFDASAYNWFEILTLRQNDWVPWINFMAEKIKPIPGVSNPREYLEYTKAYIISEDPENASFPIYTDGSISRDLIAGKEFLLQNFTIENEDGVYYQTTYSAQFGEYLLNIITNYENGEENEFIKNYLNSIVWTN